MFDYVADPANLPEWTHAFARADAESADMATPNGTLAIGLATAANPHAGTVNWRMTMPDGSVGTGFSRITAA